LVTAWRQQPGYAPAGPPWPSLTVGDEVEAHDQQGWIYPAVVMSVDMAVEKAGLRVIDKRRAQPMPPIVEGRITLPLVSGHAHGRRWRTGDIVSLHDSLWRVGKPRELRASARVEYPLTPATERERAARPGRMQMRGESEARAAVGSAVRTQTGEWLRAEKVQFHTTHSAEGDEDFGRTWYVVGRHVSAVQAGKLNLVHGPSLSQKLWTHRGVRVERGVAIDAAAFAPLHGQERVALLDGGSVLHERVGDPDQLDSRGPYVVAIDDPVLVARVRAFLKKKV